MRFVVRYEVPRDFGAPQRETRREYNARFSQPVPDEVEPPWQVVHVWDWFWALSAQRGHSDGVGLPLALADIQAWQQLTGEQMRPREVDMLLACDHAYLAAQGEEMSAESERKRQRAKRTRK